MGEGERRARLGLQQESRRRDGCEPASPLPKSPCKSPENIEFPGTRLLKESDLRRLIQIRLCKN